MPLIPEDEVKRLKEMVGNGKLGESLTATKDYGNHFVTLLSRYKRIEHDRHKDIISQEDYRREFNRIENSFLETLDEHCGVEITDSKLPEKEDVSSKHLKNDYLEKLKPNKFLYLLENLLIMKPEFLPPMQEFDKNHILSYFFLKYYRESVERLHKQLLELDEDIRDYLYDVGVISNELETIISKFQEALKQSKNEKHVLFSLGKKLQAQVTEAQRWIVKSMNPGKGGNNKQHLTAIAKPQLEIAIDNFLEAIIEQEKIAEKYSQN